MLVDEPEAGLDDLAVYNLATNLERLGDWVVVATHSPPILRSQQRLWLFETSLSTGETSIAAAETLHSVDGHLAGDRRARLGLRASSETALARVIFAVKGHHDIEVFSGLLPDILQQTRTRFLPLNGSRNSASALTTPLLFEATDCPVVIALDKSGPRGYFQQVWNDFVGVQPTRRAAVLADFLKEEEVLKAGGCGTRATSSERQSDTGVLERLRLVMFDEADVVHLLPFVVLAGKDWPSKLERSISSKREGQPRGF